MRELHVFSKPQSRKLKSFERQASFVSRKLDCIPDGVGGICFNVPNERMSEAGRIAESLGLEWMPGGGAVSAFVACKLQWPYLYAVDNVNVFKIWDISDPSSPAVAGTLTLDGAGAAIDIFVSIAYVICTNGKLHAINIDDKTAPYIFPNGIVDTGDGFTRIKVIKPVAFLSGAGASAVALWDISQFPAKQYDTQADVSGSSVAVSGRRLFFGDSAGGPRATLRNYQIGGFGCDFMQARELYVAGRVSAEEVTARDGYFRGEVVCTQLTIAGSDSETDTGSVSIAGYANIDGRHVFGVSGDPNGLVTAPISSIALSNDGTVWRNTDGATAWTAM